MSLSSQSTSGHASQRLKINGYLLQFARIYLCDSHYKRLQSAFQRSGPVNRN